MAAPHLDITVTETELEAGAVAILAHIRPHWPQTSIVFKLLTDGITNKLVRCSNKEYPADVILVRVYGQNTELLIDREAETNNIKLLQNVGFTSSLYATFNNGLAYQFIPGEILTVVTVRSPAVYPLVARKVAELHKVRYPDIDSKPVLWNQLEKFINLVPEQYSPPEKQKRFVSLVAGGVERLCKELSQLRTELSSLGSPVVFCHNDLLLANVIHQPGSVSLIDYEYAACNYQAYDIGNHFAEFVGVTDVDFSRYPDRELQWDWLRIYLTEYSGRKPSQHELHTLYVQVNKFALTSHFLWGVWSLVQSHHSSIDFDFMGYGVLKLNEYFAKKESFLALKISK